jgi:hypothetical protein
MRHRPRRRGSPRWSGPLREEDTASEGNAGLGAVDFGRRRYHQPPPRRAQASRHGRWRRLCRPPPQESGGMRERPNRHAWKACVGQPTVGSNPTPSATLLGCPHSRIGPDGDADPLSGRASSRSARNQLLRTQSRFRSKVSSIGTSGALPHVDMAERARSFVRLNRARADHPGHTSRVFTSLPRADR